MIFLLLWSYNEQRNHYRRRGSRDSGCRSAAAKGHEVCIYEKNEKLGKKLYITGKGRCNVTNASDMQTVMNNVVRNPKFLYSSFKNFTNKDILKLLNIPVKLERGNRYFPVSDKAKDVVDALEKELSGVEIVTNTSATEIITKNNEAIGVKTNKGDFFADKIILATGGKSYPLTGSTGDGYEMAKKLGHTITQIKPALVPLVAKKESKIQCQQMQGLSLRNVGLKLFNNNKLIYEDFGEMLFTHYGVTGPIILSASSHLVRQELKNPRIEIDLKELCKKYLFIKSSKKLVFAFSLNFFMIALNLNILNGLAPACQKSSSLNK